MFEEEKKEEKSIEDFEKTIKNLENKIERAKNCLVCVAIADAAEVCQNALDILNEKQNLNIL